MKTVEALISAMVLISFSPLLLLGAPSQQTDLYQYQLAEDVWRLAYLRGCFTQSTPTQIPLPQPSLLISTFQNKSTMEKGMLEAMGDLAEPLAHPGPENEMETCLNSLLEEIETETGLRIAFYSPLEAATKDLPEDNSVAVTKTIILNGAPKTVILRVG